MSGLFFTSISFLLKELNEEIKTSDDFIIVHSVFQGYLSCILQLKDGERLSSSLLGLTVPVLGLALKTIASNFDQFLVADISLLKSVASLVLHHAVKRIPGREEAAAIVQSASADIDTLILLVTDISVVRIL
jgi:hypothetical protein